MVHHLTSRTGFIQQLLPSCPHRRGDGLFVFGGHAALPDKTFRDTRCPLGFHFAATGIGLFQGILECPLTASRRAFF